MSLHLLIDESVNGFVGRAPAESHDVLFAVQVGLGGTPDQAVVQHAAELGRIAVTEDRNFARYIVIERQAHPGIIVLALEGLTLDARVERVASLLKDGPDAFSGRLTIIRKDLVRRRTL